MKRRVLTSAVVIAAAVVASPVAGAGTSFAPALVKPALAKPALVKPALVRPAPIRTALVRSALVRSALVRPAVAAEWCPGRPDADCTVAPPQAPSGSVKSASAQPKLAPRPATNPYGRTCWRSGPMYME